ncbi:MAG: ribosomal protein S18-alanine N-acetyltransferase [Rhodoferax sp.]|nr:ribosomal protein S18-alanine N-acetyltransferase [Rhodoferax sp.]
MQESTTLPLQFAPLVPEWLDAILAVEQRTHDHPWNHANFADALQAGNHARMLLAHDTLLGYFVAMPGVQEAHLLNITVAPEYQGQGCARVMLNALTLWARAQQAQCVWLEVRSGNARALRVYEAHGYRRVGIRKAYYPATNGGREDAVVMNLPL